MSYGTVPTYLYLPSQRLSKHHITGYINVSAPSWPLYCLEQCPVIIFTVPLYINCVYHVYLSCNSTVTKETAYVQALTSGLLLHRVVRDCSDNKIPGCSCISLSDPLPSDEEWRSCNHNVGYGIQFTKKFLDTMWSKDQQVVQATSGDYQPPVSEKLIHLHNLEAGRRVSLNSLDISMCYVVKLM